MGFFSSSPSNEAARYARHVAKVQKNDERDIKANNKAFAKEAMKAAKAKAGKK